MDHIKHLLDGLLGIATLANFIKFLVVGFAMLPTILTLISTALAITWYVIQIRTHMRNKKANDEY